MVEGGFTVGQRVEIAPWFFSDTGYDTYDGTVVEVGNDGRYRVEIEGYPTDWYSVHSLGAIPYWD